MSNSSKPPVWFWIVSTLALLWNLSGVLNYLMQAFATPEMLAAMPEHQREYMEQTPSWVIGCFAIAVWGGTIGSILLLIRKRVAYTLLIISFVGVLGQVSYSLLLSNAIEVYGPSGMVLPILIIGIGLYLIYFAKKGNVNGWLK